jgi:uncharacterized metal-binding protein
MPKISDYTRKCNDIVADFNKMYYKEEKKLEAVFRQLNKDYYLSRTQLEKIIARSKK